jgi:single-strand DNA-binding protein
MAGSINKVILIGNLGRNPEVMIQVNGGKIVTLSVATNETWKDKASGERRDRTEWHRVVIFNDKLAEVAERYLKKGSKVYLEGQLQTRKWTDEEGKEIYTTEVVLGKFRGELTMLSTDNQTSSPSQKSAFPSYSNSELDSLKLDFSSIKPGTGIDLDDEIPF